MLLRSIGEVKLDFFVIVIRPLIIIRQFIYKYVFEERYVNIINILSIYLTPGLLKNKYDFI